MVLRDFPQQPINLYSDSDYVVGVLRALKLLILAILVVKSYLIFSFSFVVWCELASIPVLWAICTHILIFLAHLLMVMPGQIT
jgi:hypothetical protein